MRPTPFLLALVCNGCGVEAVEKTITPADIGPEHSKQLTYLEAPGRPGQPKENPPSPLQRTIIGDEAWITSARNDEVCFGVTVRTASDLDRGLAHYKMAFDEVDVTVGNEKVTVRDYPLAGGEKESVVLEDGKIEEAAALGVPKADAKLFRVFERTATGCQKMAGLPDRMQLDLTITMDDGRGNWTERFAWRLKQ
jgi:hypothetical protein